MNVLLREFLNEEKVTRIVKFSSGIGTELELKPAHFKTDSNSVSKRLTAEGHSETPCTGLCLFVSFSLNGAEFGCRETSLIAHWNWNCFPYQN